MAFCHIKFQSIPSLMPFTLNGDPQFYGLKMSLSNTLMIDLFGSNNRMVIFSKREKKIISQQIRKGIHLWPPLGKGMGKVGKFVTCLQILFVLKQKIYRSFLWMEGVKEGRKIRDFLFSSWFKITTNSIIRESSFFFNFKSQARYILTA